MSSEESSAKKIIVCDPAIAPKTVCKGEIRFAIESKLKACVVEDDAMDHHVSVMKIDEGSVEFNSDVPFLPGSTLEIRIPTISRLANIRSPILCKTTSTTKVSQDNYCIRASFTGLGESALEKLKDVAEKPGELKENDGFWRSY